MRKLEKRLDSSPHATGIILLDRVYREAAKECDFEGGTVGAFLEIAFSYDKYIYCNEYIFPPIVDVSVVVPDFFFLHFFFLGNNY